MTFLDANPRKDVCANIPGNLQEMEKLKALIDELNVQIYNPVGLNIKWPRSVAFLFVSAHSALGHHELQLTGLCPTAILMISCDSSRLSTT